MSGPYRFNQESAKSPLDRSASPAQGVSFKTNVNRAKTKKWVTAKKNAYDGDDWGDYDEYDEYGAEQQPAPAPAPAQRYYAGGQQFEPPNRSYTDRSFTDPHGPPSKARRNSFEAGEEHRAFSTSMAPPQHQQQYGEPQRQASGADSDMGHEPQSRRDFTPSAMPPPLQTRMSPMPSDIGASPSHTQFPPRKSSIGQGDSPMVSPNSRTGNQPDKPLPFVRPADIYKRVEEERERERASLDSSRPSLDSLGSPRLKDDLHSPTSDGGRLLPPLETVAERKSEYLPDFDAAFAQNGKQPTETSAQPPVVSPPNNQGFRSVVDQAFTRSDDQRSVPPTPISKDSDSGVSRSNTDSTAGISPIMSRIPSSATSAMKRNQDDGSTPVIAEEPSETTTSVPQPTSTHNTPYFTAPKPSANHARNLSSTSIPTPTRGDSPARSPVIAPQRDLPEPTAGQISTGSPDKQHAMDGGLSGQSLAYAAREADIATAAKTSTGNTGPGFGAAEKQSQDAFLESHTAQSPIDDVLPRSRSESPSKGRVQALAGKFGDVSSSRRGSTQSNLSRNSVQSWEKSQDNSRAPSPTKGTHSKPSSPVKEFRPHLPGQWESYATTAMTPTPLDQGEQDRGLGFGPDKTSTLKDIDLTPTTAKHPVDEVEHDTTADPLSALKNAGAAMAQSIKATVGMDETSSEPSKPQGNQTKGVAHGDLYSPRPLYLERGESSVSSMPPTPPAKDTPANDHPPQLPAKEVDTNTPSQQKPADYFPQSTPPSADDEESDRLRKEIVASLTPVTVADTNRASLQPASPSANRSSSILPAEYDSYWADGGTRASTRFSQGEEPGVRPLSTAVAVPTTSQPDEPPKISLLNRFSWEANNPPSPASGALSKGPTVPEPTKTTQEDAKPLPTIDHAVGKDREVHDLPEPLSSPSHTITVTQPEPLTEVEPRALSPVSPIDNMSLSSPTREHTRSPGLHVVNSAVDPEAVDLPPRLSADVMSQARNSQEDRKSQEAPNPAISAAVSVPEPVPTSPTHGPVPTSPTAGKPLGAREIATINSTAERIATYNQTREHWATHDHGLGGWLSSALEANPGLTSQTAAPPVQRTSTGTVRHKHTASLSLLGKFGGSSHNQAQHVEQQQQSASAQAPVSTNSPSTGASPGSGAGFDRRAASRQLEAKGKDLLHTANVLSGKGLTGAKGLFAKGKSRFGREKAPPNSSPSSREASEEPEFMVYPSTTTPERPLTHFSIDTDSPLDRKKRRFSISSFHRRSRPSSIVLPSNPSFSNTPRNTPPREVSRILGEDKNRPHSYHTPESWAFAPVDGKGSGTPPPRSEGLQVREQARLGILPSPAKSLFGGREGVDEDEGVPPVPKVPESLRLSHDLSHEVLQSVIRYATPPVGGRRERGLEESVEIGDDGEKKMVGDERMSDEAADGVGKLEDTQWPLVNTVPVGGDVASSEEDGALVQAKDGLPSSTTPSLGSQALEQTESGIISKDIGHTDSGALDDDDQPPQLNYDPIVSSTERDSIHLLPPYLVPSHLDVSDDEDYKGSQNAFKGKGKGKFLLEAPQPDAKPDVSPLLRPTMLPSDDVPDDPTSRATTPNEHTQQVECGVESADGVIGSSPSYEGNDSTPTLENRDQAISPTPVFSAEDSLRNPKTRVVRTEHAPGIVQHQDLGNADSHGHVVEVMGSGPAQTASEAAGNVSADGPIAPSMRRACAAPLQVLHAIEYAASDSSFLSWDQDSVAANSVSESSQPGDMRDESDVVTPVAQVPRIIQHGQADKAEKTHDNLRNPTPNGYIGGHDLPMRHMRQHSSDLTVPERSKSMLSMISSMVSEGGTPISPASSNAGRSTPSTIRRMQYDSSGRNPLSPNQIPEESMVIHEDSTPTAKDDDFDLYADHNGIVKDLHDENGQPLRVTQASGPSIGADLQSAKPGVRPGTSSEARDDDVPRSSTERPMSFIAGPTDQEGRPQDQVNQPSNHNNAILPPTTEQFRGQGHQNGSVPSGTNYSAVSPAQAVQQPNMPNAQHGVSPPQPPQPSLQGPAAPSNGSRGTSNMDPQDGRPRPQVAPNPGQQPIPAPNAHQLPIMNGQPPQPGKAVDPSVQDLRSYANPGQPLIQGPVMQGQMMTPDHDPRFPNQARGPSPTSRNEYEYQQQMMQRQAQFPRPQGMNGQGSYPGPQVPVQQAPKQQEKSSSKPKFSSVFKNFGGKLQGHSHQQQPPPKVALHPPPQVGQVDPARNGSFQSGVSSLHQQQPQQPQQPPTRPIEQPSPSGPTQRPASNGAESHFSHASQGSTQVQPTDSRLDLRKPASPGPFQGIPPQIMPHRAPMHSAQPQAYRASTSGVPETGKKKRFSTFGNIFSRGNDQKKTPKAQRHSTAPPMQAATPQYPPQQPQFRPHQPGMPIPPGQFHPGQFPQGQYPPGQLPPQQMRLMGPQFASPQTMSPITPQSAQGMDPRVFAQQHPQMQPRQLSQQSAQGMDPRAFQQMPPRQLSQQQMQGQGQPQMQGPVPAAQAEPPTAYLRTKQLAEQHEAERALAQSGQAGAVPRPGMHAASSSFDQQASHARQGSNGPPPGGYYSPNTTPSVSEKGAYIMTPAARLLAEQQRQQSVPDQGLHGAPPARVPPQQYQQSPVQDEATLRALQARQLELEQQRLGPEARGQAYQNPQVKQGQQQQMQQAPQNAPYGPLVDGRQQPQRQQIPSPQVQQQQSPQPQQHSQVPPQAYGASHDELLRAHQERQQYEQQLRSQQYADRVQPTFNQRSVSGPLPSHGNHAQAPTPQRHVSGPPEPQYETPQIPAAYSHVSGAFVSPRDRDPQAPYAPSQQPAVQPGQYERHYSDPRMPALSPQVSAQSQMPPNDRTHSDASSVSVISAISTPAHEVNQPNQRAQKPRMSSISEVHQGERPWHLNFPEGATEQEIVRARQRQFMQQQFSAQQQQHAERAARSPSPRTSPHSQSPVPPSAPSPQPQQQGGGFKELLPRSSPQPYAQTQVAHPPSVEHGRASPNLQPPPTQSGQAANAANHLSTRASPIMQQSPSHSQHSPSSREAAPQQSHGSPAYNGADSLQAPPSAAAKVPHSPMFPNNQSSHSPPPQEQRHASSPREQYEPTPPQGDQYSAPPPQEPRYEETMPDEPPPSYDGPGVPNDGMDKSRPEQPRPPNINTDVDRQPRGRTGEPRQRQPSLGILQHPQPASMAASPQRSSADMGADSLRRQLLQNEEYARMERIQRAQIQRAESEREKQERDAARARARELERSVSGGGSVGSIRSVGGSRRGGHSGWERRGSSSRQVFELPAVEDDEPSMRATSYPGQEWVPPVWTDD